MINLFLDDKRVPSMSHNSIKGLGDKLSWVIVRDYFEFVNFLTDNFNDINIISFDHDLACYKDGVEFTGKTAADFLINYCLDNDKKIPDWYVHSDNTSGKNNIIGVMLNYLKNVEGVDVSNFRYYHNGIINNLFV